MRILNNEFQGPFSHNKAFNRDFGCVYVILSPNGFVVDVGQTASVNSRLPSHDRKQCWIRNGCPDNQLYVLIHENEQVRLLIESAIRDHYNPACGIR